VLAASSEAVPDEHRAVMAATLLFCGEEILIAVSRESPPFVGSLPNRRQ
jgi:hypothetical protein